MAFYTEVHIPEYIDVYKFMGRGGCHVKNITERSGVHYMWVDMNRRTVEIWGRESRLPSAIASVKGRIRRLTNIWVPYVYDSNLRSRIDVKCWNIGHRVFYDIAGEDRDTHAFFEHIIRKYPFHPYMTQVEKRTPSGILVAHFTSCD